MYTEELYSLVDELNLNKEEADNLKAIIIEASYQYLLKMWRNQLTEKLIFNLDGWYINQSQLLRKLGISVHPDSWIQHHTIHGDDPFGPSDSISWKATKYKTSVAFPTSLFKTEKKENVLKLIKTK